MFEFAHPLFLTALAALPFLWYYVSRVRRNPTVVTPGVRVFKAVRRKRSTFLADWFYLAAAALLIVAAARPRTGDEKVIVRSRGIDIVLALDMSGSMRAIDVPRGITNADKLARAMNAGTVRNRLDTAKEEIRKFILARPNDRIGLIGFADLAYSFAPPTLDHAWLLERLRTLEPGQLGDATGIASAVSAGVRRLKNSAAPRRVLVLFTDGANTAENRLTPEQSAALAKEFNCVVHTVGIGSDNAYILAGGYGFQKIQDSFDGKLLDSIARITGGICFHAEDGAGMKKVMKEINALEKTNIEQPRYVEYREFGPGLALAALLLLFAGFFTESILRIRLP